METHVKVLAWFNLILGGLGVLLAAITFAGGSLIPALVAFAAGEAGFLPASILQAIVTLIVGMILVLSLPSLILGFGLYNLRPWARILGIVLAAIHLFNVPLGTLVSVYAFWVLLNPQTAELFRRRQA
ncbi:MAG: hypothetical protein WHT08_04300 [Bryobacteraceae bacterium]|jgi:uncharacterized membrane protein (DUF2068 family)